ncbi:hypothetical protein FI667_g835, partial [Globisporangium splendens]
MINGIPQAASGNHMPESDEFIDHGLSYYYDPTSSMHHLAPPPPPPPSNENAEALENDSEFYDCEEEGSFIETSSQPRPPPLPPSELTEVPINSSDEQTLHVMEEVRAPPALLLQIQLGVASLRHVGIHKDSDAQGQRSPRRDVPSVQATLLEQIKMKQRTLRPVELQPSRRPSLSRTTAAPFAVSIARILERRSVIAYDSDSGDDEDARASENDCDPRYQFASLQVVSQFVPFGMKSVCYEAAQAARFVKVGEDPPCAENGSVGQAERATDYQTVCMLVSRDATILKTVRKGSLIMPPQSSPFGASLLEAGDQSHRTVHYQIGYQDVVLSSLLLKVKVLFAILQLATGANAETAMVRGADDETEVDESPPLGEDGGFFPSMRIEVRHQLPIISTCGVNCVRK